MWKCWRDTMIQYKEKFVPKTKIYKRNYPKWMTGGVKRAIKKRNKAWQRCEARPQH